MKNQFYIAALLLLASGIVLLPKPSFEQSTNDTIRVNGTNYVIPHTIAGGKVLGINLDLKSKAMIISIRTTSDGNLTISLPRTLIDAKQNDSDTHYTVQVNNHGVSFKELVTADYRELTIPFRIGSDTIEIRGTQVVPEFGPLASLILIMSIAVVSIIAQRKR
jgi:hypothetical protein